MHNPLLDKEFLKQLDMSQHKETWARITALSTDESPIEYIEGRVTGGSLNIDGNSALRRICNLDMVAKDININDFYWGLKNKFKLEIGLSNTINSQYDDIIWFKQGVFVITSFNTSLTTNNYNISISGKDKMCLLNGDMGGNLPASIDFAQIETQQKLYTPITFEKNSERKALTYQAGKYYTIVQDDYKATYELALGEFDETKQYYKFEGKEATLENLPLYNIIREAVHTYAKEPYYNIVINDLDESALELLEYRGDDPIYLLRNSDGEFQDLTINGDQDCKSNEDGKEFKISEFLEGGKYYNRADKRIADTNIKSSSDKEESGPLKVKFKIFDWENQTESWSSELYTVAPMQSGETAGYRVTELTYPGELISSIGESLTSILDKIKNMLGNFEYFYDVDGRFIFQKKKTYINTSWNPIKETEDELYVENAVYANASVEYSFEGNNLISSFQNAPVLNNLRNDFSVWGTRKTITGAEVPIHARYAIDKKPYSYTSISISRDEAEALIKEFPDLYPIDDNLKEDTWKKFYQVSETYTTDNYDWREIIYRMALDYYKYGQMDSFASKIINANKGKGNQGEDLYITGFTGYEQYYIDIQGFWRQLYDPNPEIKYTFKDGSWTDVKVPVSSDNSNGDYTVEKEWQSLKVKDISCDYYISSEKFDNELSIYYDKEKSEIKKDENGDPLVETFDVVENNKLKYWNRLITESPQNFNFWIEFLDQPGELEQFAVYTIGERPKVVNDTNIKAVYYKEIPNIIYQSFSDYNPEDRQEGYTYAFLPSQYENVFSISAQGKSAQDEINELMYNHSYCIENITVNAIPIYYLEPNVRIYVHDDNSKIDGQYIISRLTIPLTYNGTMSISATKAPERIL